jgi:hypothetical protein
MNIESAKRAVLTAKEFMNSSAMRERKRKLLRTNRKIFLSPSLARLLAQLEYITFVAKLLNIIETMFILRGLGILSKYLG